jgi:hypothetical protein
MPFKSKAQYRLCYVLQRKKSNSKWNCEQWAKETKTPYKKLPERLNRTRASKKRISKLTKSKKLTKKSTNKLRSKRTTNK